jgi:hypothetical protein
MVMVLGKGAVVVVVATVGVKDSLMQIKRHFNVSFLIDPISTTTLRYSFSSLSYLGN